jgi:hypothetical protein
MTIYHTIAGNSLESARANGLKRSSRGSKGAAGAIVRTDQLLDAHRPAELRQAGVSRDDNLYGYYVDGRRLVNIVDGELISPERLAVAGQVLLELEVDAARCYVSDLDTYDAVRQAVERDAGGAELEKLAISYWDKVVVLSAYHPGSLRRPEVMVTYDVPPADIRAVLGAQG